MPRIVWIEHVKIKEVSRNVGIEKAYTVKKRQLKFKNEDKGPGESNNSKDRVKKRE